MSLPIPPEALADPAAYLARFTDGPTSSAKKMAVATAVVAAAISIVTLAGVILRRKHGTLRWIYLDGALTRPDAQIIVPVVWALFALALVPLHIVLTQVDTAYHGWVVFEILWYSSQFIIASAATFIILAWLFRVPNTRRHVEKFLKNRTFKTSSSVILYFIFLVLFLGLFVGSTLPGASLTNKGQKVIQDDLKKLLPIIEALVLRGDTSVMPELEKISKEIDETSKKVSGKLVQIAGAIFGIWSIIWIACIIYSAHRLRQSIEICIDSLPAEERLAKARQNLSRQLLRNAVSGNNNASSGRINKSEISINMILEEMMEEDELQEGPLRSTLTSSTISNPGGAGPVHIEHSASNKTSNKSQITTKSSKFGSSSSSFPSLPSGLSRSSLPENSDRPFALILERNETTLYPRDFQIVLDANVNSTEKARRLRALLKTDAYLTSVFLSGLLLTLANAIFLASGAFKITPGSGDPKTVFLIYYAWASYAFLLPAIPACVNFFLQSFKKKSLYPTLRTGKSASKTLPTSNQASNTHPLFNNADTTIDHNNEVPLIEIRQIEIPDSKSHSHSRPSTAQTAVHDVSFQGNTGKKSSESSKMSEESMA